MTNKNARQIKKAVKKYHFNTVGNIKLGSGVWAWSTCHGDFARDVLNIDGKPVTVKGTCGNCKDCQSSCYAAKAERMYPSVKLSRGINTWGIQNELDRVFDDLAGQIQRSRSVKIVRINQSGELTSKEELVKWIELALANPAIKFYVYTKMYKFVLWYLGKKGNDLPDNFFVLFSIWHKNGLKEYEKVKDRKNVKAFVYDDGVLNIKPTAYCPAYKGKHLDHDWTCDRCKLCYNGKGAKVIGCKAH